MAGKSVEEQFAEEQARLAISQQYLSRDGNPDFDQMRQEQLDRNRIPGQLGRQQLSPSPTLHDREDEQPASAGISFSEACKEVLRDRPYRTLAFAAGVGIILGALWKS